MAKFSVIVPAAGKSERFGGAEKKTFAKLDGRPIFLRSLEHFVNRPDVCETILVVAPEDVGEMKSQYGANLGLMGIRLIEGGAERRDSVALALKQVCEEAEYVAIHDAARPCVTEEMINAVFTEAVKSGAATLANPITGTIKRVSESMVIDETVSRDGLYEAQTPQAFKKQIILDAYEKLDADRKDITDDVQIVELVGVSIAVVKSDATNLKITTRADIQLAGAILKSRPSKPIARFGAFEEAQW